MLKKTFTYTDYNGIEKKTDEYFNLTQAEILKMQMGVKGGLIEMLKQALKSEDAAVIIDVFEKLIDMSYGIKTADGKFKKSPEALEEFKSTPAYSDLFMSLITDPKAADEFTRGVIPADVASKLPADITEALPEDLKNVLPAQN